MYGGMLLWLYTPAEAPVNEYDVVFLRLEFAPFGSLSLRSPQL